MSRISAHTIKGQEWLEQVVLVGLRKGGADADWAIEVHGSDNIPPPDGDDDDNDDDSDGGETTGPAVYLIFKRKRENDNNGDNSSSSDPPNIPLHFFNY